MNKTLATLVAAFAKLRIIYCCLGLVLLVRRLDSKSREISKLGYWVIQWLFHSVFWQASGTRFREIGARFLSSFHIAKRDVNCQNCEILAWVLIIVSRCIFYLNMLITYLSKELGLLKSAPYLTLSKTSFYCFCFGAIVMSFNMGRNSKLNRYYTRCHLWHNT